MPDDAVSTHCVTCADELLRMVVVHVAEDGATVIATADGGEHRVAIDLVDGVAVGDVLLVHGGVALQVVARPGARQP